MGLTTDTPPDGLKGRIPAVEVVIANGVPLTPLSIGLSRGARAPRVVKDARHAAEVWNSKETRQLDSPISPMSCFSETFIEDFPIGARNRRMTGISGALPEGIRTEDLRRSILGSLPTPVESPIDGIKRNVADYIGWWDSVAPAHLGLEDAADVKKHARERQRMLLGRLEEDVSMIARQSLVDREA